MKDNGNFISLTVSSCAKREDTSLRRGCMLVAVAVDLFLDERKSVRWLCWSKPSSGLGDTM